MSTARKPLQRVLLKLSGEAFAGGESFGLDPATVGAIADEIVQVHNAGVETAVVAGGGNFIRGVAFSREGGMDQAIADQMGMLGTVMNCLALQDAVEKRGVPARVMSAISVQQLCETFIRRRALRHLEKRRIVILASGTGNPFFTTDTAAALRAVELGCEALIKCTKVDGVYDQDPKLHAGATRYAEVTYDEAIAKRLGVMDPTAFTMCQEHDMPIIVLSIYEKGGMLAAVKGEPIGTLVGGREWSKT